MAALGLVVLAVVLFVVLGSDDQPPPPDDTAGDTTPPAVPTVVREVEDASLRVNIPVDLNEIIFFVGPAANNDLQYLPLAQSDGLITPLNGAQLAKIGPTDQPAAECARGWLTSTQVPVSRWVIGEVLCVRTNAGRPSLIVLNQKLSALIAPPPPPLLQVSITTFEP